MTKRQDNPSKLTKTNDETNDSPLGKRHTSEAPMVKQGMEQIINYTAKVHTALSK